MPLNELFIQADSLSPIALFEAAQKIVLTPYVDGFEHFSRRQIALGLMRYARAREEVRVLNRFESDTEFVELGQEWSVPSC